jgi:hypothetical protein
MMNGKKRWGVEKKKEGREESAPARFLLRSGSAVSDAVEFDK